ncbi:uncharacterized protein PITG_12974 [Phytophthora infestans T30-4]|uniref:Uncharacterized protein n=1 Tax=Phytophthora infestans (strain T30-4) TaxID=403677 RepID=D0NJZ8_PHYIT|nr:uncharacterized protein PITG_12974 [Phytophthora infestans T30-4]EEY59835.1 conserved hypothetical protein [Phytophthora infestans T30-4]|eukprot:XP_002900520.1 conserved hypothetical protein [Phytophthora infestans T30-4]
MIPTVLPYPSAKSRRLAKLKDIQAARRLDAETALSTDHESSRTGLTSNTSSSELFTDDAACLLEPEVTEGPLESSSVQIFARINQALILLCRTY